MAGWNFQYVQFVLALNARTLITRGWKSRSDLSSVNISFRRRPVSSAGRGCRRPSSRRCNRRGLTHSPRALSRVRRKSSELSLSANNGILSSSGARPFTHAGCGRGPAQPSQFAQKSSRHDSFPSSHNSLTDFRISVVVTTISCSSWSFEPAKAIAFSLCFR